MKPILKKYTNTYHERFGTNGIIIKIHDLIKEELGLKNITNIHAYVEANKLVLKVSG